MLLDSKYLRFIAYDFSEETPGQGQSCPHNLGRGPLADAPFKKSLAVRLVVSDKNIFKVFPMNACMK